MIILKSETYEIRMKILKVRNYKVSNAVVIEFDNKEYYCDYFIGNNLNLPKSGINVLRRNKCVNCPFALICGGTCQAITRSINIDEKSCEVRKEIFKQIIYFTS